MARKIKRSDDMGRMAMLIIFLWFVLLTLLGNKFGQLGLGVILLVGGIWTLARSKQVWTDYKAAWKKLPKSQRSQWNEPKDIYYYINVVVLIPLAIVLGLALIFISYLTLMG